ncbi:MAG: hypothetical protein LBT53_06975 [Puniceicoccales bacterium]|jgi:hypothetical protein|nr:hypothetical protein [Puniceicoccales bacterium]
MAKGRAGTHTSVIDAAKLFVSLMEACGRVSRGVIAANVGSAGHTIKVLPQRGALRVTVTAKGAKQEFHVYGISLDAMRALLGDPRLGHFLVRM